MDYTYEWSDQHEKILVDWADKAMVFRWLHNTSYQLFYKFNTLFTIPVIIISTITGVANFAQERIPPNYINTYVMIVGALNIVAGIVSTIQQYLKISDFKEAHRLSSIAWDKFYRNIKIELSKNPKERLPINQFIKMCKEEYDRLMETSPDIKENIIKKFTETFKNTPAFKLIRKPEICDSLISTSEFVFKSYNNNLSVIQDDNDEIIINTFINDFKNTQNREPLKQEIIEQLQEQIPTDKINQIYDNKIYQDV